MQCAMCSNAELALLAGECAKCLYLGVRGELALYFSKLRTQSRKLPLPFIRGDDCLEGVPVRLLKLC